MESVTYIALKKSIQIVISSYFSTKTYVVGNHCQRLNEMLPMSTTTNVLIEK